MKAGPIPWRTALPTRSCPHPSTARVRSESCSREEQDHRPEEPDSSVTDVLINAALGVATDDMFAIGSAFVANAKKTEKFVEMTASELKALSL